MKKIIIIIFSIIALIVLAAFVFFGFKKNLFTKTQQIEINNSAIPAEEPAEDINLIEPTDEQAPAESPSPETISPEIIKPKEKPIAETQPAEEKEIPPPDFKIINKKISWGYSSSSGNRKIDTFIIHSSYDSLGSDPHSLDGVLKIYKDYGVSAHYIIDRSGKVYRLVDENNIAYHAGVSQVPDGRKNVNTFSLGVEIINTKSEPPNSNQYSALNDLTKYLKKKYDLKYILGHNQIAPDRKDDPWNFNWKKIYPGT